MAASFVSFFSRDRASFVSKDKVCQLNYLTSCYFRATVHRTRTSIGQSAVDEMYIVSEICLASAVGTYHCCQLNVGIYGTKLGIFPEMCLIINADGISSSSSSSSSFILMIFDCQNKI